MTNFRLENGEKDFVEARLNPNQIVLFVKICERKGLDKFLVMEEVLKDLTNRIDTFDLSYKLLSTGLKSKVDADIDLERESGQSCLMYYLERTSGQFNDEKVNDMIGSISLSGIFLRLQEGYMKSPFFWDTYSALVSVFARESLLWDVENNKEVLAGLGMDVSDSGIRFVLDVQEKLVNTKKTSHIVGLAKDATNDSAVLIFMTKLLIGLDGEQLNKILNRLGVDGVKQMKKVLVDHSDNQAAKYKVPFSKKQLVGFMKKAGLVFDEDFEESLKKTMGKMLGSSKGY